MIFGSYLFKNEKNAAEHEYQINKDCQLSFFSGYTKVDILHINILKKKNLNLKFIFIFIYKFMS